MESLSNCHLLIDIEFIEQVLSKDGLLEIHLVLVGKKSCVIYFDRVWDYRCSIEAACIARFANFIRKSDSNSSILIVNDSEYIKYFISQSFGTRPTNSLVEYIVFDKVDTVISVLSEKEPKIKMCGTGDG